MSRFITPFTRLALVSAAAAGVAYGIGSIIPDGDIAPVPAAITAVTVTSLSAARAWRMSILQIVGITVGATVALLSVRFLGFSIFTIAFLVLVSFGIVALLKKIKGIDAPQAAISISVSVIIVLGSHLSTTDSLGRFFGVMAGAVVGLVFSLLLSTNTSLEDASKETDDLFTEAGELASDIAVGISRRQTGDAHLWSHRAQGIRARFRAMGEELDELGETSKWSPLMSSTSAERLRKRYNSLEMTITRLIAVTSDLKLAERKDLLHDAPTGVLTPLAKLFEDVSMTLTPDEASVARPVMVSETKAVIEAASRSDMKTEEIAAVSGIALNARRLVSLDDTQPMPVFKHGNE